MMAGQTSTCPGAPSASCPRHPHAAAGHAATTVAFVIFSSNCPQGCKGRGPRGQGAQRAVPPQHTPTSNWGLLPPRRLGRGGRLAPQSLARGASHNNSTNKATTRQPACTDAGAKHAAGPVPAALHQSGQPCVCGILRGCLRSCLHRRLSPSPPLLPSFLGGVRGVSFCRCTAPLAAPICATAGPQHHHHARGLRWPVVVSSSFLFPVVFSSLHHHASSKIHSFVPRACQREIGQATTHTHTTTPSPPPQTQREKRPCRPPQGKCSWTGNGRRAKTSAPIM